MIFRWIVACAIATALMPSLIPSVSKSADRYDLLLKGGRVVDGTGAPWYLADVAIRDGRVAAIGRLTADDSAKVLDAAGLVVAPGFIDMMGQTASPFLKDPAAGMNLLTQGITTINAGEGDSAAPLAGDEARQAGWSGFREYFDLLDRTGMPVNVVQTIGHTQVRRVVLGEVDRRPFPAELERMKELVREAMQAGAIGLSTALIYPPAVYASTEEISDLARVAGEFGGGYYTHMRNEGDRLLAAIDEALEIGRAGGCRVHIFHLKAAGRQNWGQFELAIARIKAARSAGQQVAADIYPYINNGLGITAFIHPRHAAEGAAALRRKLDDPALCAEIRREMETNFEYENWYRHVGFDWNRVILGELKAAPYADYGGQSLEAIAKALSKDPWDVFFDVARFDVFCLPQTMSEANLIKALREEFVSVCTDVGPAGGSSIASHPRAAGAFPRVLARFVRDLGTISLERAIAQMTAVAANEVFQHDRGRLAVGLPADIVVFDYAAIADRATFAEPRRPADGVLHVVVNGWLVLESGKFTGARPGRVLRGPGYRQP
ncbi:MAG: D-aminoacylase [Planctomycetaceae bacterium]|nr:D-aminoacylase [Planctomycetaceae bacterium]